MTGTRVYPWDELQFPGCTFLWPHVDDESSLRAQASKQAKRRAIIIVVNKVPEGLLVTYETGVL